MGTTFTPGQLAQLSSIINIAIATALPKVVERYDPKVVLKALNGKGRIFAGHLGGALEQAINKMLVLMPRGTTTVVLTERHDPNGFYQTHSGLYIWDDYRTRIAAHAEPSEAGAAFIVESFDLTCYLTDKEIEDALPRGHLFDETQVCGTIAGLIADQPNGEAGELVKNDCANLFYTHSYVVLVRWVAGNREWSVGAWKRDARRWRVGGRVFSPAN